MRRLLLVGGGHTHIEVVRRWGRNPVAGWSLDVVSLDRMPVYSGMVPGLVAGQYQADQLSIDLPRLCERAGARFLHGRVDYVDAGEHRVRLSNEDALGYDLASIDVGSTVAGGELPGVAEHALASRPIVELIANVEREIARVKAERPSDFRVAVIGGGAAGVELCFCLHERLLRDGLPRVETCIVDAGSRLLPGASRSLAKRVTAAMGRRGIQQRLEREVSAIEPQGVRLEDDTLLPADLTLWVTGPAAQPLALESGLPVDARGFVRIDSRFQVEGHDSLFAVGDCASLRGMKRAGVYAVRAGPLLDHNLRARMLGGPCRRYRPQRDFLTLLNLGDGSAIGAKWGRSFQGRWVMQLKDRIDRGFMAKYA